MAMTITSPCATKRRDALVERLFESAIGMLDVMSTTSGSYIVPRRSFFMRSLLNEIVSSLTRRPVNTSRRAT